jgi:hypothetical protein
LSFSKVFGDITPSLTRWSCLLKAEATSTG